ncbi:PREDICTED: uncharacterized protein LOC105559667 isoform X2 [Vollenhovia emeryi]|uniref:uncharacterized protein LOC105559667 isoform X2 n=1 Tax=Vollenhovia emeryi TaxID=411798 RepID=UPI0005F4DDAD|nr:PREDICTED: uncharacterized protein LOC105559667 isoform X2 [Vollenhovia emeryi]
MARLVHYCTLNKILLLSVGLWPYHQSKLTQFQSIVLYAILSTGIIFQITSLITCTSDLVIKVLSSIIFVLMSIIQYNTFYFNIEDVKNLLMELQHVHNKLKDENEIAIVEKYSCIAKRYTIVLMGIVICGMCSLVIVQLWLNIAKVDSRINASEPYYLFIMEYFVDQKKYFYLIVLHTNTVFCFGDITMMAQKNCTPSCCVIKANIYSYRIEHAINIDVLQNITFKNKILMTEGIICAVDIHRQAMKLSKYFLATFENMVCCLTVCVVAGFSLNLFQVSCLFM